MKRRYFALWEETAAREKKELLELQGQEIPIMTKEENELVGFDVTFIYYKVNSIHSELI